MQTLKARRRSHGQHAESLGHPPSRQYIEGMVLPASTLDDLVRRITAVEAEIRSLGVRRLAVFGSVARGTATPESDADVLVQFATGAKTFDRFMALSELLEDRLGRPVELVTTEALSPYLGPRILAEARDVLRTP